MWTIIKLIVLRHLTAAKSRSALTMCGVALGVAVVFAVSVLNRSVMASFRQAIEDVSGKAQLCVGRGTGVAEELLERVRAVPGVVSAAPIIEDTVRDETHAVTLALLGVDALADRKLHEYEAFADDIEIPDDIAFLNDPHALLITRAYAARFELRVGDELSLSSPGGSAIFTVRGLLSPKGAAGIFSGELVVMDVYAAQLALARGRRFDRIDVVLEEQASPERIAEQLTAALERKAAVSRPEQRTQEAEGLLASFKLALSITSLVAVFVGAFIVYNATAIAVAQRRREIGMLRAIGMSRNMLRWLFMGEAALVGALGCVTGLLFGLLLARASLSLVGETVSALYLKVQPHALEVESSDLLLGAALGFIASMLAAWYPARRASQIDPVLAMQRRPDVRDVSFGSTRAALLSCMSMLLMAAACAWLAHRFQSAWLSQLVNAFCALGVAFAAPMVGALVGRVGETLLRHVGTTLKLGSQNFRRDAGRSAIAIAALGLALANVVTIDCVLGSMKSSTHAWLGRAFRADIFVLAGTSVRAKFEQAMPEALLPELLADPAVAFVQPFRMLQHNYQGAPIYLMSEDLRGYLEFNELAVADGDFRRSVGALQRGESVGVSQTFARQFGTKRGDSLRLQTVDGPRDFRVDLIYIDYRTDTGAVLIERAVFTRAFADNKVDLYGVYLTPGASAVAVRERIANGGANRLKLLVLENHVYVQQLLGLIDRSLALSHAGEAVAILVAVLGMFNVLAVSVLDRKTQFGTLRSVGASRGQLQCVVLTEALLMAFSAAVLGVIMGLLLSAYSVHEALRFQLGWQLELSLSLPMIISVFAVAQLVGALSAWLPMRAAAATSA
ncbi:MAG TPA: FtsX-like permease family protein [Polyangiales bacterium]|nr:FtsX-like permease family protein [Polyangiales bacterium]